MPTLYAISLRWIPTIQLSFSLETEFAWTLTHREFTGRNFMRVSRFPNGSFENYETAALKARVKVSRRINWSSLLPLLLCTFILKFSAAFGEIKMEFFNLNSDVHEIRKFSQLNFPSKNFLFSLFMFLRKVFNISLKKFLSHSFAVHIAISGTSQHQNVLSEERKI